MGRACFCASVRVKSSPLFFVRVNAEEILVKHVPENVARVQLDGHDRLAESFRPPIQKTTSTPKLSSCLPRKR
jgi:hypothetical protein